MKNLRSATHLFIFLIVLNESILADSDSKKSTRCTLQDRAGSYPSTACRERAAFIRYVQNPNAWQQKQAEWDADPGTGSGRAIVVMGAFGAGKTDYVIGTVQAAGVPLKKIDIGTLNNQAQVVAAADKIRKIMREATDEAKNENKIIAVLIDELPIAEDVKSWPDGLNAIYAVISEVISKPLDARVKVFYTASDAEITSRLYSRSTLVRFEPLDEQSRAELFEYFFKKHGVVLPRGVALHYAQWTHNIQITPREIDELAAQTSKEIKIRSAAGLAPWTTDEYKVHIIELRKMINKPYVTRLRRTWNAVTSDTAWQVCKGTIWTIAALAGIAQAYNGLGGDGPGPSDPKPPTPADKNNPDSP